MERVGVPKMEVPIYEPPAELVELVGPGLREKIKEALQIHEKQERRSGWARSRYELLATYLKSIRERR